MLYKIVAAAMAVSSVHAIPSVMRKQSSSSHLAPEHAVVTEHRVAPTVTSQTLHEQVVASEVRVEGLVALRSHIVKASSGSVHAMAQDASNETIGADKAAEYADKNHAAGYQIIATEAACARCEQAEDKLTGKLDGAIVIHKRYEAKTYHFDQILAAKNAFTEQCGLVDTAPLWTMIGGILDMLKALKLGDDKITVDEAGIGTKITALNGAMQEAAKKHTTMEQKITASVDTCGNEEVGCTQEDVEAEAGNVAQVDGEVTEVNDARDEACKGIEFEEFTP